MDDGELRGFGELFQRFLEEVVHAAPRPEGALARELGEHLGADVAALPVTGAVLSSVEHGDLQLALDGYLDERDRHVRWIGLSGGASHADSFADLLLHGGGTLGPVGRREVPTGPDQLTSCVSSGVALVDEPDTPRHAMVVRLLSEHGPGGGQLAVDVLSEDADHGAAVLADLRDRMRRDSVYRGHVVALTGSHDPYERQTGVTFLRREQVDRTSIVLPDGVLRRIERRTVAFDEVADQLTAQGHHRRRGILLHGPPGTGKTLTVRYLVGRQVDRTVVVLTGQALAGGIGPAAAIARRLQPSTIVLEDVDLVARQRHHGPVGNPLLFELLNELDGLGPDADVLVLLTTNRADLLEPALASRPGRVDLAVELPLPAAAERRRLLGLAIGDVATGDVDWEPVVERIAGTPASFVPELVRTASLQAALDGSAVVAAEHVDAALDELLDSGPVTAALLGARAEQRDPDW